MPHEIYLAHDVLLAFGAGATIQVEFELGTEGSEPVSMIWEYWDGQVWRAFRPFGEDASDSRDATNGLTRSGVVTLQAECGKSEKTAVNGIQAYWIRARLDKPLPPDPARALALVDRIRVRSVMERVPTAGTCSSTPPREKSHRLRNREDVRWQPATGVYS